MSYSLSNTQRKDLLERATTLSLAIPSPPYAVRDLLSWAREVLPPEIRRHVKHAEEQELTVRLPSGEDDGTLSRRIGAIVPDSREIPDDWQTIQVIAVIATLDPLVSARHQSGKLQWVAKFA